MRRFTAAVFAALVVSACSDTGPLAPGATGNVADIMIGRHEEFINKAIVLREAAGMREVHSGDR